MREFLLVIIIGLAVAYAADAYWYNNKYFSELTSMITQTIQRFR